MYLNYNDMGAADMETSRLAKISVFAALFIAFLSMCITVKFHMDIERNLDLLTYGVSNNLEAKSDEAHYTAKALSDAEIPSTELQQNELTIQTTETATEDCTQQSKQSKSNASNGIAASVNKKSTTASEKETKAAATKKETTKAAVTEKVTVLDSVFVFSKNSKKLHSRTCPYAAKIKEENMQSISAEELQQYLDNGYEFCGSCHGFTEAE